MTVITWEFTIETTGPFPEKEETLQEIVLNRRTHNRYSISAFSAGHLGKVTEISSGGMRIEKMNNEQISDSTLIIPIGDREIKANVVWQNGKFLGLRCAYGFNVAQIIKKIARNIKEPQISPAKIITDDAIMGHRKKDFLSCCMNLMEELENPDLDMTKLKSYMEELSDEYRETAGLQEKERGDIEETKEAAPVEPSDLKGVLIDEARLASSGRHIEVTDLDFAIARLGLESVKEISINFLQKKLSDLEISLTNFNEYTAFIILKTVFFKRFAHFFGFKDEGGEGGLLLALETAGIEILINADGPDSKGLKDYYISSSRIYSELSRIYERNNFGRDLLMINGSYFKDRLERFEDLYDGYILAHLILNPCYRPENIRLAITKKKLIYSFFVYITFLATRFIIDKDRESASILMHMLKRAGMNEDRISNILNDGIDEANNIMGSLGLKGKIRLGQFPHSPFRVEGYLLREPHFKYLIRAFRDFSVIKSIKRMALMYEDEAYAHFILTKLLTADDIGLYSNAYCVIPCNNISEHELYLEEFSYFDILIFKNIDRLPSSHMKKFIHLWKSFEGKIIVTFSKYSFLDFDNEGLYQLLKSHIVDFPSYFANKEIYERMIDHTIDYIRRCSGKQAIDRNDYLGDFYSMDYIKANELRSYVQAEANRKE